MHKKTKKSGSTRTTTVAASVALMARAEGTMPGSFFFSSRRRHTRYIGDWRSDVCSSDLHGIERGRDLRQYPLFAFSGAGPVHCWQVAKVLKVPRILIPFGAGAMSAFGLLAAPLAFDFVRTGRQRLDRADWPGINRLFAEMEEEGRALLSRAGVPPADVRLARIAEMRYAGQGHEVECAVPLGALSLQSLPAITASFESAYRALYHRLPQGVPIEALNWRLTVSGPNPRIGLSGRSEPRRDVVAGAVRRPAA